MATERSQQRECDHRRIDFSSIYTVCNYFTGLLNIVKFVVFYLFHSLEQLERPESSSIPDGYTLSVAFACLLEIVKSLDALVQENTPPSSQVEVVGWIEPEVFRTSNETGVGTETIRAAAKEGSESEGGG